MSNESKKSWQITPLIALGLIFVTLKLMGYINWSWWWVTAPFWVLPTFFYLNVQDKNNGKHH